MVGRRGCGPAPLIRFVARFLFAAGVVVLADTDPAGVSRCGCLGSEERRRVRGAGRACLEGGGGGHRCPPLSIRGAAHPPPHDRAPASPADRHRSVTESGTTPTSSMRHPWPVITVHGKAPQGSSHLTAKRRHPLCALTLGTAVTLAQAKAGAKTNETTHFGPCGHHCTRSAPSSPSSAVLGLGGHLVAGRGPECPLRHPDENNPPPPTTRPGSGRGGTPAGHGRRRVPLDPNLLHRGRPRRDCPSVCPPGLPVYIAAAPRSASARTAKGSELSPAPTLIKAPTRRMRSAGTGP
ncbi:hypothetical protein HEB29_000037 [Streptomyces fulvorobeus]|uniref:Secreted protein n=1 Tax=Streptomyces fulvorobeus TaxID=284028 RepID=A0A7Y9KRR1_9ACTN|nr:hypothetical protein [Streptomyces fulvorobeus]